MRIQGVFESASWLPIFHSPPITSLGKLQLEPSGSHRGLTKVLEEQLSVLVLLLRAFLRIYWCVGKGGRGSEMTVGLT